MIDVDAIRERFENGSWTAADVAELLRAAEALNRIESAELAAADRRGREA